MNRAEHSPSEALKILLASPNPTRDKAECFHSLAKVYLTRVSQQSKKKDFCETMVKSIAQFEAEKIYKHASPREEENINAVILKAEVTFIDKIFGGSVVERFKETNDRRFFYQNKPKEIR